ncbi:MAG: hypothetical protein ABIO63_02360 [Casimicrobiaceae bacterium]
MRNPNSLNHEGNSIAAGVRAAVVVVVLGAFAAAIDNVSLRRHDAALPGDDTPSVVTAAAAEPIVFPHELRAHEGEVAAPVATF